MRSCARAAAFVLLVIQASAAQCPAGPFQLHGFNVTQINEGARPYVILVCNPNKVTRLDPLVKPGTCSSHMHTVVGSNRFGPEVTVKDMTLDPQELANTTCNIPADNSIYWAPTLYFHNQQDNKYYVVPNYMKAYYFNSGNGGRRAKMPIGLRMKRGDPYRKEPLLNPDQIHNDTVNIFWMDSQTGGFPAWLDRGDWQARIMFPGCWDGKNLQSSDPSSYLNDHMAFRDETTGLCPSSHPVRIPQLFTEVNYQIGSIIAQHPDAKPSDFLFATGDRKGWGAHADYISGWQQDVLDAALDTCFNNDWSNPKCAFNQFNYVQSASPARGLYKQIPNETVSGIGQLHVTGVECQMSGFPPASCSFQDGSNRPPPLQNIKGVFTKPC